MALKEMRGEWGSRGTFVLNRLSARGVRKVVSVGRIHQISEVTLARYGSGGDVYEICMILYSTGLSQTSAIIHTLIDLYVKC